MCGVVSITNESFSRLVQQYEPLVYTICFQLVRDAAAAEDLTQDTFLSAYIHRSSMPPGYERQWLGRIAANKAKDHLQSAWKRRTLLPGDGSLPDAYAQAATALSPGQISGVVEGPEGFAILGRLEDDPEAVRLELMDQRLLESARSARMEVSQSYQELDVEALCAALEEVRKP